jgi:hypothetical protein
MHRQNGRVAIKATNNSLSFKGQEISKGYSFVFNFSENESKISALASKSGRIKNKQWQFIIF